MGIGLVPFCGDSGKISMLSGAMCGFEPMLLFPKKPPFIWSSNQSGLAIRFSDIKRYEKAKAGRGTENDQMAFIRMQMLLESGQAEVEELEGGVFIASDDAVRLDRDTRECFGLPDHWPGGFRLQTNGVPQLQNFYARIGLVSSEMIVFWDWSLRGPILEAGGIDYLPTAAQYAALNAYRNWLQSKEKDEYAHLSLLATLQEAKDHGVLIHLETYESTRVARAEELFIDVREEDSSGDLILRPVVSGNFPNLNPDEIEKRLIQFQTESNRAIIRVGKTIVLLSPEQTEQAKAVIARNRISKSQRRNFEKNPAAWLAEHVFPDIEIEFSPRVTGVGHWSPRYLGADWDGTEDWFGKKPIPSKISDQKEYGGERPTGKDDTPGEIDDRPVVPLIIPNDEELEYGRLFLQKDYDSEWPFPIHLTLKQAHLY